MNKIKFYPFNNKTIEFAPSPYPASKNIPDWYKKQPGNVPEKEQFSMMNGASTSTIKRCMPIFDIMTAGYIIPIPCDIYIDATNPEKITWSVPLGVKIFGSDMVSHHSREQYSHYPINTDKYHKDLFRIMPFWSVKTEEGYSSLFINPIHKDEVPFWTFGGLIDTDKFITDGHISMLIEKDFKGVIKQGTPFVQVIPFKREEWEMEIISPDDAQKEVVKQRLSLRSVFVNGYKNKMRTKKVWN